MEATSDQTMLFKFIEKICYVVPNTAAGRMPSGLWIKEVKTEKVFVRVKI